MSRFSVALWILKLTLIALSECNNTKGTSQHSNNWAVLVGASRYWFNYRHIANTLSIYHSIKRMGIPDSQIIVMISDDMACNDRNPFKARMRASHAKKSGTIEIYDDDVEVDYRGEECSVDNLLKLLTNRVDENTPITKRLLTDENSNILFYITGHGGDLFLKFHDKEEIQSQDLADAFQIMHSQQRYHEILFMVDTCQAATLFASVTAPNVIGVGSSVKDESSYSYKNDHTMGISLADRFTHFTLEFFEQGIATKNMRLLQLFESYTYDVLRSHAKWQFINFERNEHEVLITDFFSAVTDVDLMKHSVIRKQRNNMTEDIDGDASSCKVQPLVIDMEGMERGEEEIGTVEVVIDVMMRGMRYWYAVFAEQSQYQMVFILGSVLCGFYTVEMSMG